MSEKEKLIKESKEHLDWIAKHPPVPAEPIKLTDMEKFIRLFNEVGVTYTVYESSIEINEDSMYSFGGVDVEFTKEGKFKGFGACS